MTCSNKHFGHFCDHHDEVIIQNLDYIWKKFGYKISSLHFYLQKNYVVNLQNLQKQASNRHHKY